MDGKEEAAGSAIFPYSASYKRFLIKAVVDDSEGPQALVGKSIRIGGLVKSGREADKGAFVFLHMNDGSCMENLQVMVTKELAESDGHSLKIIQPAGTSLLIEGTIERTPEGKEQKVEMKATKILHLGVCDNSAGQYPIAKKKQTLEFLREKAHLRPRTSTIQAVARIRSALAFATHEFFTSHGFVYVHTPIITTSDCEGAGELFQVTTLLGKLHETESSKSSPEEVEAKKQELDAQKQQVAELRSAAASETDKKDQVKKLKQAEKRLGNIESEFVSLDSRSRIVGGIARTATGDVDYSKDFFSQKAYLTVSGQIQGEYYACGLSNIYTFGPTFRAENSHTSRHLAEFWMIEPELVFCDLQDDMQCAEDYVKFCCKSILKRCRPDLEWLAEHYDKTLLERLQKVADAEVRRISYTEAIDILTEAIREKKKKFEKKVVWGDDLASEHERYIAEEVCKGPVIVYNYPKDIKSFYMKLNDDQKTVAAMDMLVPGVGELIGGSQREDRLDVLEERLAANNLDKADYEPYLDLRKYGSVPHSGFGLGFERLVLFATGIENIRDVMPFPRWPGQAKF